MTFYFYFFLWFVLTGFYLWLLWAQFRQSNYVYFHRASLVKTRLIEMGEPFFFIYLYSWGHSVFGTVVIPWLGVRYFLRMRYWLLPSSTFQVNIKKRISKARTLFIQFYILLSIESYNNFPQGREYVLMEQPVSCSIRFPWAYEIKFLWFFKLFLQRYFFARANSGFSTHLQTFTNIHGHSQYLFEPGARRRSCETDASTIFPIVPSAEISLHILAIYYELLIVMTQLFENWKRERDEVLQETHLKLIRLEVTQVAMQMRYILYLFPISLEIVQNDFQVPSISFGQSALKFTLIKELFS